MPDRNRDHFYTYDMLRYWYKSTNTVLNTFNTKWQSQELFGMLNSEKQHTWKVFGMLNLHWW